MYIIVYDTHCPSNSMAPPDQQNTQEQCRLLCGKVEHCFNKHPPYQRHECFYEEKSSGRKVYPVLQAKNFRMRRLFNEASAPSITRSHRHPHIVVIFDDFCAHEQPNLHPWSEYYSKEVVVHTSDRLELRRSRLARENMYGLYKTLFWFMASTAIFSIVFGGQLVAWKMQRFTEKALQSCEERQAAKTLLERICAPSAMVNGLCQIIGFIDNALKYS